MGITSVRLRPELAKELKCLAEKHQRSKSWLINEALAQYLARDAQEEQRWAQTLQALDDVSQGRVVQADAMHAWLESWGSEAELPVPVVQS